MNYSSTKTDINYGVFQTQVPYISGKVVAPGDTLALKVTKDHTYSLVNSPLNIKFACCDYIEDVINCSDGEYVDSKNGHNPLFVVFKNTEGQMFCQEQSEFFDGRFVELDIAS